MLLMKVLAVAHNADFSGGSNRSLYTVIKLLKNSFNIEFTVILPSRKGALIDALKKIGVETIAVPYYGVIASLGNKKTDILKKIKVNFGYYNERFQAWYIGKRLDMKQFDLIYTNTRLPILGAFIAKNNSLPHICHVREFGPERPYWPKWDSRQLCEKSDTVIAISESIKKSLTDKTSSTNIVTVYNGIDSPMNLECHYCPENGKYNILITGRLVKDKGQEDAVRAVGMLVEKGYSGINLYLAGSAPDRALAESNLQDLKRLVAKFGIDSQVHFLGEVSDMTKLRDNMDCELMCAVKEAFGRVTVEAMRSNLLVIGSASGGTTEIINDGVNGILYRQGDSNDLASKIEWAINHFEGAKIIADNGYIFGQSHFTAEKNASEIYEIFCKTVRKMTQI